MEHWDRVTFCLPPEDREAVDDFARTHDLSRSQVVRRGLRYLLAPVDAAQITERERADVEGGG